MKLAGGAMISQTPSELVKLVHWRFTPSVSPPQSLRRIL
jgi:hypothetical protein